MKKFIFIILLFFISCSRDITDGRLVFNEPNPDKGFNYPYYLFIPDDMDKNKEQVLIVEPNNSGFVNDELEKHREKAERTAGLEFYSGNYAARKMNCPLLVPVFPRSKTNWKIYTHSYDRDLALQQGNDLERIDLQLLAMTKDVKKVLTAEGFRLNEQFLMTGFSASGTFVNRFTAIHPEKVMATAAGGLNGLLILPIANIDSIPLNFPLGVNNFPALFNKTFDSVAFKNTPQFLFMGELDENDAIPYEDGYDADERELVYTLINQEMQPERWNKCKEIYAQKDINAKIVTFPGIGHEQPESVKEEIVSFFMKHLPADRSTDGD